MLLPRFPTRIATNGGGQNDVTAGITDGLMYKAARNTPLKPWQTWFNKVVAAIRCAVERHLR
jgi:hypothetical protein